LTQWEKLEGVHANLFGILVGSRRGAAVRAFGTVAASATRVGMVVAAAEVVLAEDEQLMSETLQILKDSVSFSPRRNEIAHGVVNHWTETHTDAAGVVEQFDHGHFLLPAGYAVKYRSTKERAFASPITEAGKYAYTADQVMTYAERFARHYSAAVKIMFKVLAYVEQNWTKPSSKMAEGVEDI